MAVDTKVDCDIGTKSLGRIMEKIQGIVKDAEAHKEYEDAEGAHQWITEHGLAGMEIEQMEQVNQRLIKLIEKSDGKIRQGIYKKMRADFSKTVASKIFAEAAKIADKEDPNDVYMSMKTEQLLYILAKRPNEILAAIDISRRNGEEVSSKDWVLQKLIEMGAIDPVVHALYKKRIPEYVFRKTCVKLAASQDAIVTKNMRKLKSALLRAHKYYCSSGHIEWHNLVQPSTNLAFWKRFWARA